MARKRTSGKSSTAKATGQKTRPELAQAHKSLPNDSAAFEESLRGIKSLVQGFAKHIKQLKSPEYKESHVRLHYIDEFWRLLRWDVENRAQKAPQDVEVVVEPSMESLDDSGLRSREPDYLFRVNGFARFIVEAKKPTVDLDTDKHAIFQAKRYAWSAAIPFAILMDFEQFRLYDTTLKPILHDPARGKINEFALDFQHYAEQWDVLWQTFHRDAAEAGSLEALRAKIRKVPAGRRIRTVDRMLIDLRGDEPVDKVFLDYLDTHRRHFASEIYRQNRPAFPDADKLHGAARLTEAVQRLMDRLVFMRVCEDRGIAEWGFLRGILNRVGTEGDDLYAIRDYGEFINIVGGVIASVPDGGTLRTYGKPRENRGNVPG